MHTGGFRPNELDAVILALSFQFSGREETNCNQWD